MGDYEYWDANTGEGLTDSELHQRYDEFLEEVTNDGEGVVIGSLTYSAARVLKEVDPIAYRVGFHDWLSFELDDGNITEYAPEDDEA